MTVNGYMLTGASTAGITFNWMAFTTN
jgi:hypothetical protein